MTRTVTPQPAHPVAASRPTHERIAMRAYEKWVQRGCQHGCDEQDWLEAEAELAAELSRTSAQRTTTPARAATPAPQPAPSTARRR